MHQHERVRHTRVSNCLLHLIMAESYSSRLKRLAFTIVTVGHLAFVSGCQSPSQAYYRELKIDSGLHLVLMNGFNSPISQPPDMGSYYAPFYGAFVDSVDHWEKKPEAFSRERSLYLEAGKNDVLDRTVKTDEILKGPFGSINAKRECFYTKPLKAGFGSVSVGFLGYDVDHETPLQLTVPPSSSLALTSISLIRIFRTGQDYMITSANYESDGSLGSLNIGGVKSGRSYPGSTSMYRTPDSRLNEMQAKELAPTLALYGIPSKLPVNTYLRSHVLSLPITALRPERDVLNEFYGFGKLIRQDELTKGAIVASRWLQPSQTGEEKDTLNSLCDARFREQQALGLPTVE